MTQSFLPGRARESFGQTEEAMTQAVELPSCRFGYLRPKHRDGNVGQAGLLAYGYERLPNRLPMPTKRTSGLQGSGASPITAAAPQRICTVFPILPRHNTREPVELSFYYAALRESSSA